MVATLNVDVSNEATLISPDRKPLRIRPLKAYRHFRNLIANKEDTEQVFHIIGALNGNALMRDFKTFLATEKGQARMKARRYLPPLLDDHARWKALPDGTVGRAYVDFMEREGLTAQGLVDEYDSFGLNADLADDMTVMGYNDPIDWYGNRLRDTHDLCHIMTGYGRDALGEACVLGFSFAQNKGLGVLFISYMAGREIKKTAPKEANIMAAVKQGRKIGKAAQKLVAEDILELMEEPLESARARLGLTAPTHYTEVHETLRKHGFDPKEMLAAA